MGRQIGRSREGIWKHSVQTPSADEIRFDQPIKSVAVGRVTRSNLNSAPETSLLFRSKIRLRCCCHPLTPIYGTRWKSNLFWSGSTTTNVRDSLNRTTPRVTENPPKHEHLDSRR